MKFLPTYLRFLNTRAMARSNFLFYSGEFSIVLIDCLYVLYKDARSFGVDAASGTSLHRRYRKNDVWPNLLQTFPGLLLPHWKKSGLSWTVREAT